MGIKYNYLDYVIKGWQEDDLPLFCQIKDILVVNETALFHVIECETVGIDRHYHSFSIHMTGREAVIFLSELIDYHTFQGHKLKGNLYITTRSFIEKLS